jgi:hypothetical protein
MKWLFGLLLLNFGLLLNSNAIPPVLNYAGQVTVNGEAFDGAGLFKFALVNADGTTTYWSNDGTSVDGSEPQASVSVPVNGGLYAVLLGNTAQQGMGPIDPSIFAQHTDAKLRVWFSDGVNGFQQLSPDRPFASVPYAFSAGTAQTAGSATIAPGSIDRSMLSEDIRSDLNRTISHNDLSPQIKADINATIGLDRLSAEVILKLEQNATITNGSVTGSKMADGVVTATKIASKAIGKDQISDSILKYLKPEITSQPQAQNVYADTNATFSVIAEGKYLTYKWKKDGADLTGETNATLTITDANATLHDGNYSVVVSNDFGTVESDEVEVSVLYFQPLAFQGLKLWLDASELSSAESLWLDKSGNGNNGNKTGATNVLTNAQNGHSVMYYNANGQRHKFNMINDIRTVFWVISQDTSVNGQGYRHLLADTTNHPDFHSHNNGKFWSPQHTQSMVRNGIIRMNGSIIDGYTTNYPNSLSIISLRTTANAKSDAFGYDRTNMGNQWIGKLGELLIYNSVLSDKQIQQIEGYLAHKWGLLANLPSNHLYKSAAP